MIVEVFELILEDNYVCDCEKLKEPTSETRK